MQLCAIALAAVAVRSPPGTVELASGATVANVEFDPTAFSTGKVYYSAGAMDNLVAATAGSSTFAKDHAYAYYGPDEDAMLAAAQDNAIPLKTFWSAKLNDTLTTASPAGLAFAAEAANGYAFKRVEGYCLATPASAGGVTFVQMWSEDRKDSFLVVQGGSHAKTATSSGYVVKWNECSTPKPPPAPIPGATGKWTPWPSKPQGTPPWPNSKDLLGWEYLSGANPGYGGGDQIASSADTWYPSWSSDGNLYTPWTDGHVHDDVTGAIVGSGSGGKANAGYNSTTGQAKIVGDDPFNLTLTEVKTFTSSTYPYQGRYPCGSLVYKGTWWYGTYYLDNPNVTVGNTSTGPNPGPNCGNWCVQGPVVDFRHSTDNGATWHEERVKATAGDDNLFGETAADNAKVKFGAPHFVDFGQELEHSPDGKAYIVGHGASRPEAVQAWMLGDAVYMARVNPTVQDIADRTKWEFYGGGSGDSATWITGDVSKAQPLVTWNNHTGTTTMTYFPALKKYILTISTASYYPSMVKQFDTYFLESDSITGPWTIANYMSEFGPEAYFVNHPSKFLAAKANTTASPPTYDAFLLYSANFAFHNGAEPPNSGYHMNLQQARFPLSKAFAAKLERMYMAEDGAN